MNIIVTGAGRGIGYEIVRSFSMMPGHKIIAVSRNISGPVNLSDTISPVHSISFDLMKEDIETRLKPEILNYISSADILINNAGALAAKPFEQLTENDFDIMFATNVRAPFLLIRALLPLFVKGSHIVNIGSMGGYQGSRKFNGLSIYSASKAAIASLSESMAQEFLPKGISVNCLALGAVQTEMLEKAFPGYKAPLTPEEMGRFIAEFALTGSKFFNGKVLPVTATTP